MSLSSKVLKDCESVSVRPYMLADFIPEMADLSRDLGTEAEGENNACGERLSEIERDAYVRGFEAGERAGMEAGLEKGYGEAANLIKTASILVEQLEGLRQEIIEKSKKEMLKLSLAVARKIVHAEITVNKEVIVAILKAAVKNLAVKDSIRVRLHPRDAEYISGEKLDLLASMGGVKDMTIEEDPSVPAGGCFVEAGLAEVDARVDQQMDEVINGLMKGPEGNE